MKVWIDGEMCIGVALCADKCPEVFAMADDGIAHVKAADGTVLPDRTPVEFADTLLDGVIEAAEECPEDCIFIEA